MRMKGYLRLSESQTAGSLLFDEGSQAIRVGRTRVTLDTVIRAFHQGATPEQICQDYSSLALTDVYSVIACYLRHGREVDQYLAGRAEAHGRLRREIQEGPGYEDLRARLLARIRPAETERGLHSPSADRASRWVD